jgi:hypothetical protein
MSGPSAPILERFRAVSGELDAAIPAVTELRGLSDAELLELSQLHTAGARAWGSAGAVIAGELAFRSRPQLGSGGLARRTGHRTVEHLLKSATGATKDQVVTVVAAGTLLVEAADEGRVDAATGEVSVPSQPWLKPVAVAVAAGQISTSAARSISSGLGKPNSAITADQLQQAATELVGQAVRGVDADALFTNARNLRLEADLAGVKLAEDEARAVRGLTHYPVATGGGVATWRMDAETYALFLDFFTRTTSPKLGGVRFIDPAKAEKAQKIQADTRDYKQLASDALLHFLTLGMDADDTVMIGSGAPVIRVTVAEKALETGTGLGRIDGQATPISLDTVKRLMETGTILRIGFDPAGTYVEQTDDPSADHRLFTRKQREILATKFGGCMDPDCDRPPSWCEAHHIRYVYRDGGKTVILNGILLCKHHHLMYHNDGYEIMLATDGTYWKIPPTTLDPTQTPIPMPLKTRNLNDLQTAETRAGN